MRWFLKSVMVMSGMGILAWVLTMYMWLVNGEGFFTQVTASVDKFAAMMAIYVPPVLALGAFGGSWWGLKRLDALPLERRLRQIAAESRR